MTARRVKLAWLLFAAALVLRVGWILLRWGTHGAAFDYSDEELHWQLATNLVRDGALISDDGRYAARMPLYPLFLAPFASLGSNGILAAKLAQAVLGSAAAVIGYQWASAAVGRRAALVAGVLIACDPFAIFFANLLLTEVPFTLLVIALLASAWGVVAAPKKKGPLLGLALLGTAAIMTRPSSVGLIPLLWFLILGLADDRRVTALRLLLCPAVLGVAMLPWGLRNMTVLDSPAWLSTNGGVTLYDAQGPQADGSSNQAFLRELPELARLGEVAADRRLRQLALAEMRGDSARVLRLAGVKFLRTWSPIPHVAEYRGGWAALVGAAYTLAVLIGAFVGLACTLIRRGGPRALQALLWLPVLYFTLVHCVYIGSVRYRVPLSPLLAVATAAAFTRPITAQGPEIADK